MDESLSRKEAVCLREKLKEMISGGVVTLLYALGLTLTLLKVLGLMAYALPYAAVLAGMTAVMTLAAQDRRWASLTVLTAGVSCLVWLLMGGASTLVEVLRALEIHLSGLHTALPFVAQEAAMILTVLCGGAAFFVTRRSAGPLPALVTMLLAVVLIWLGNAVDALWYLLPAVIASIALLLLGEHELSHFRVLPLAAAAVLLSYTGVAVGGAAIPPLKEAADTVRQKIYDMFLFTGSRDEFSLADVGYYPQGEGQLGGPAIPSEDPVMVVITPRKVYLRGVIRNVYTGRSWEDGTESKRYLWDGIRFQSIRATTFDMGLPQVTDPAFGGLLEPDQIIVRMLAPSASSMFMPQRVRTLRPEGRITPYFNAGSEIFTTRNLRQGDVWEVEAPLIVAGDRGAAQLVAASEAADDPNWQAVQEHFLALPEHLEQEVFDIAWGAVGTAQTPYEKAMAILRHLRLNYTYTLDAPIQPADLDFVSTFLLLEKQGYCTHFASAMTVLCRMVGLPARYVEGFVATPDQDGLAMVTGEQGHAWTEIYFKGYGWMTFDATPAGGEIFYITPEMLEAAQEQGLIPTPTPEAPAVTATPSPTPSPTPVPTPTATPPAMSSEMTPTPEPETSAPPVERPKEPADLRFLWWLLPILAALTAILGRVLWMTPLWQFGRQKTEFGRWLVWAQAAHDALRQLGLSRNPDETPMGFFARVDATNRIPEVLSQLSGQESLMFYGHAVPLPEETAQARHSYEIIRAQLTSGQRLSMHLLRALPRRRAKDITVV